MCDLFGTKTEIKNYLTFTNSINRFVIMDSGRQSQKNILSSVVLFLCFDLTKKQSISLICRNILSKISYFLEHWYRKVNKCRKKTSENSDKVIETR